MRVFYTSLAIAAGIFLDLAAGSFLGLGPAVPFFSALAFLAARNSFWAAAILGFFWDSLSVMPFGTYLAALFLAGGAGDWAKAAISTRSPFAKTMLAFGLLFLFFAVLPLAGFLLARASGEDAGWLRTLDADFVKAFLVEFLISALLGAAISLVFSRRVRRLYV